MATLSVDLPDDLLARLNELGTPAERAVLEMIVMDLFRREEISGGRAAELLGWPREKFMIESGKQGIPFIRYSPEDLTREVEYLRTRCPQPSLPTPAR
jgi:predicted HTH domain antitoxin